MKKVTYLLLLMFATVLLTTSCEEDELITPIITLEELEGQWNFVNYTYSNIVFTVENYSEYENDYDGIVDAFVNWEFDVDNLITTRTSPIYDNVNSNRDFTKDDNIITIGSTAFYTYTIISYELGVLKMKMNETPFNFDYDGGILTLSK